MSAGILHKIGSVAELGTPAWIQNPQSEQPTIRDLVFPGSGYLFSDEFACLLKLLCGDENLIRDQFEIGEMK
jgi:hypothetical protein